MIRVMEGLPDDVVAVEAVGTLTADDYESVLMPKVAEATAGDGKAKLLVLFGSEFEGYEAEAALDDMRMGLHNWGDFERIAFVSDHGAYRALVKGIGFMMPGEVRIFGVGELDEAKQWIAGVPNV